MSNEIGSDCELSSLPNEAQDDFVPSSSGLDEAGSSAPGSDASSPGDESMQEEHHDTEPEGSAGASEETAGSPPRGDGTGPGSIVTDIDLLNKSLLNASEAGDCLAIRQLVASGASPNAVTPVEKGQEYCHVAMRPLHLAACGGHLEAFHTLVELGATVGLEAGTGETELHFAAESGHAELVGALLETAAFGFEVDAPGCGNASALMSALANGHLDVCELLLKRGADVNHSDAWSTTGLHLCAMRGRPDGVHLLCRAGAEVDATDWGGRTPLHVAAEYGETQGTSLGAMARVKA